jgi:hypothetical protein
MTQMQKKRLRFHEADYFTRMAFMRAEKLKSRFTRIETVCQKFVCEFGRPSLQSSSEISKIVISDTTSAASASFVLIPLNILHCLFWKPSLVDGIAAKGVKSVDKSEKCYS